MVPALADSHGQPCTTTYDAINLSARSYHFDGVNAALADGSVRFVLNTVDPTIWLGLGTRAGGEAIGNNE